MTKAIIKQLLALGLCLCLGTVSAQDTAATASAAEAAPAVKSEHDQCVRPEYPRDSLRNEETGTVNMQFLVSEEGRVVDSKVVRSSGFYKLDMAALTAIAKCRFKPARLDGKPVQAWVPVQYEWSLD